MTGKASQGRGGSTVKIRKRRSFSAIPDDILEDKRMRTETRLVLGWLIGRPDGWIVCVRHVMTVLGLSEGRWKTSRREMEKYGYLQQVRNQTREGTFAWEHSVTDMPVKSEQTIGAFSTDGASTDGKAADIPTSPYQEDLNTLSPYPFPAVIQISQACSEEAQRRLPGYDIQALETEWRKAVVKKGCMPGNPDKAFLGWTAIYVKNHPLPYGGTFRTDSHT